MKSAMITLRPDSMNDPGDDAVELHDQDGNTLVRYEHEDDADWEAIADVVRGLCVTHVMIDAWESPGSYQYIDAPTNMPDDEEFMTGTLEVDDFLHWIRAVFFVEEKIMADTDP